MYNICKHGFIYKINKTFANVNKQEI